MNPLAVIHRIEDLQVLCFAIVFAIMVSQARRDRTLRFLLLSYAFGAVVSFSDVTVAHSTRTEAINLALISARYAAMTYALAAFLEVRAWLPRVAASISAIAMAGIALAIHGTSSKTILALDYGTLATQFFLLGSMVLSRKEKATRTPRQLLAVLFFASVAIRCCLLGAVVRPSPGMAALRDQLWFINATLVGCMVPFTIIWMMNSRVHSLLRKQSVMDPLTGLLNRRGLQQAVSREMARYARGHQNFAVAVADIDHFKSFNDTHGHGCGDLVLQAFARTAQATLRQTDIIARTGGEEFTILLAITSDTEMLYVIDRVRAGVADIVLEGEDNSSLRWTVSIGVTSTRSRPQVSWQTLVKEADTALYEAKRSGRNRTVPFLGNAAQTVEVT